MVYVSGMGEADSAFARLIRDARKRHGWSQDDLADVSELGRRTISRWENGTVTEPDARQVIAAVDSLGISRRVAFEALGWLDRDDPASAGPEPDPVSEELLELRQAVASVLQLVDEHLGHRQRQE